MIKEESIRYLEFERPNGSKYYVAQIGYKHFDKVGRYNGFDAEKTSPEYDYESKANKWAGNEIKETIKQR